MQAKGERCGVRPPQGHKGPGTAPTVWPVVTDGTGSNHARGCNLAPTTLGSTQAGSWPAGGPGAPGDTCPGPTSSSRSRGTDLRALPALSPVLPQGAGGAESHARVDEAPREAGREGGRPAPAVPTLVTAWLPQAGRQLWEGAGSVWSPRPRGDRVHEFSRIAFALGGQGSAAWLARLWGRQPAGAR